MNRDRVRQILENLGVPYAVIGAIALAVRGAPRFTLDFDLLTTDRSVLRESVWSDLRDSGVNVDVRKGDVDDPLAGVVRIGTTPDKSTSSSRSGSGSNASLIERRLSRLRGISCRSPWQLILFC